MIAAFIDGKISAGSSELTHAHDKCFFEQGLAVFRADLRQVGEQRGERTVEFTAQPVMVAFVLRIVHVGVQIPTVVRHRDEARACLRSD